MHKLELAYNEDDCVENFRLIDLACDALLKPYIVIKEKHKALYCDMQRSYIQRLKEDAKMQPCLSYDKVQQ